MQAATAAIIEFERAGRDSPMVFDAIRMRLLEIGEAATGIPAEMRDTEPDVPWGEILGMRNWMAHRWRDTAHTYVWATVDDDLAPLAAALNRMIQRIDQDGENPSA
jgi:uncharacterized protein with HEPN domain